MCWYIFIENWFIYMHNFYCPVFLKTIHIVLKIFWLFLFYIYIYILYNPMYLYLYTSLASIIFRGTPCSALSYNNINSKTYKATMGHILFNGITTLLWHGTTLLFIMIPHYYVFTLLRCHTSVAWCYDIMLPHYYDIVTHSYGMVPHYYSSTLLWCQVWYDAMLLCCHIIITMQQTLMTW